MGSRMTFPTGPGGGVGSVGVGPGTFRFARPPGGDGGLGGPRGQMMGGPRGFPHLVGGEGGGPPQRGPAPFGPGMMQPLGGGGGLGGGVGGGGGAGAEFGGGGDVPTSQEFPMPPNFPGAMEMMTQVSGFDDSAR